MKKIIPLILLFLISATTVQAQLFKKKEKAKKEYQIGNIPVINNKVTFEETIAAEGMTAKDIEIVVQKWFDERFVEPTVIGCKQYEQEDSSTFVAKVEEYIVFKKKFFVLNRSRIYYFLTITCNDGSCKFNMSRITYWWDDEADDGGQKFKAEDCITDEKAIDSKGKLRRFNGKFRTKTIDLKETLLQDLKERLTSSK